jgi:hypothetical protein
VPPRCILVARRSRVVRCRIVRSVGTGHERVLPSRLGSEFRAVSGEEPSPCVRVNLPPRGVGGEVRALAAAAVVMPCRAAAVIGRAEVGGGATDLSGRLRGREHEGNGDGCGRPERKGENLTSPAPGDAARALPAGFVSGSDSQALASSPIGGAATYRRAVSTYRTRPLLRGVPGCAIAPLGRREALGEDR